MFFKLIKLNLPKINFFQKQKSQNKKKEIFKAHKSNLNVLQTSQNKTSLL